VAADDDGAGVHQGVQVDIQRRIPCFCTVLAPLDIIWIAVFTVVYLLGSAPRRTDIKVRSTTLTSRGR
jgi:hypothetical protein